MCLQNILIRFTPSIILTHPPFLEQFQQVSFTILFSHMNTKYFYPSSPFPYALPASTGTKPQKDLFYLPALFF
jgi:hypothetical protein